LQIFIIYFSCGPQGGGPVAFSTAIITWCKLCASYYLFGAESLFNLAVLDCVKPDIDQVASVVYCMIEWKLKRQQIKLLSLHTVNTEQFHGMDENDNTKIWKSGTQMEQLSYNITATSGLHCNRMLHTMVQSVFITPFTIWLKQGNQTSLKKCLLYLFKKRKLFSRKTTVYTCILTITKEYKE
jgi:hypothetical protein